MSLLFCLVIHWGYWILKVRKTVLSPNKSTYGIHSIKLVKIHWCFLAFLNGAHPQRDPSIDFRHSFAAKSSSKKPSFLTSAGKGFWYEVDATASQRDCLDLLWLTLSFTALWTMQNFRFSQIHANFIEQRDPEFGWIWSLHGIQASMLLFRCSKIPVSKAPCSSKKSWCSTAHAAGTQQQRSHYRWCE